MDKRSFVEAYKQIVEVEDAQRQAHTQRQREQHNAGDGHLTDQVVEPRSTKQQLFAVVARYVGDTIAQTVNPLVDPAFLVAAHQVAYAHHGEPGCQQEIPPHQDEQCHKGIAHKREPKGHQINGQCPPAQGAVD